VRGPGHGRSKREDLGVGEQILESLRCLDREERRCAAAVKGGEENEVENNVLLKKTAIKETQAWEDESDDSYGDEISEAEEKRVKVTKEKLVNV
jgi:hypothetical protein